MLNTLFSTDSSKIIIALVAVIGFAIASHKIEDNGTLSKLNKVTIIIGVACLALYFLLNMESILLIAKIIAGVSVIIATISIIKGLFYR